MHLCLFTSIFIKLKNYYLFFSFIQKNSIVYSFNNFTLFSIAQIPILNFLVKEGSLSLAGKTERVLIVEAEGDFLNVILADFFL